MFQENELAYLVACVEAVRSQDSAQSRLKANVLTKLLDEVDALQEKKPTKKKE